MENLNINGNNSANNKFMVQLYQKGDFVKILDGSPWLLDKK